MRRIGIDQQFLTAYQDAGIHFREIFPPPTLFETLFDPDGSAEFSLDLQRTEMIFREDSFDPTTRIRRGRFYKRAAALPQPSSQPVLPRTVEDYERLARPRDMFVFDQYQFTPNSRLPKFVALGTVDSVWRVLSRPERMSTGEFLFVLKARLGFGVLPEVDHEKIPELGRAKAIEALQTLIDAAHRESPGSVVDRARDAAQWCLGTWAASKFGDTGLMTKDLWDIIKAIRGRPEQVIATDAANIVRTLHARKPNEQQRRGTRPVMEDDAELAVRAVAFMLREFGWAAV
jgi:hypothetical protein